MCSDWTWVDDLIVGNTEEYQRKVWKLMEERMSRQCEESRTLFERFERTAETVSVMIPAYVYDSEWFQAFVEGFGGWVYDVGYVNGGVDERRVHAKETRGKPRDRSTTRGLAVHPYGMTM